METVIRIYMEYDKDEVAVIAQDYITGLSLSKDTKEKIVDKVRNYFVDNKKEIHEEIDTLICKKIEQILADNKIFSYEVDDNEW